MTITRWSQVSQDRAERDLLALLDRLGHCDRLHP